MTRVRSTPIRTCVGCRQTSDKRTLVRIVRTPEGDVHLDSSGKANGRGAYVCVERDCFDASLAKGRLNAALRVNLKEDDVDRLRREFDTLRAAAPGSQQGR